MNDLPEFINNKSIPIMFAGTGILFTHSHTTEFNVNIHRVFEIINTGLQDNYFSLHFEKSSKTRNSPSVDNKIGFDNKLFPSALHTRFLGLNIY